VANAGERSPVVAEVQGGAGIVVSMLLRAKVAAITLVVVLGASAVAAAATGSLPGVPGPARPTVSHGSDTDPTTIKPPKPASAHTDANGVADDSGKGPDVSPGAADLHGLCNAYAHNSAQAKTHSTAMKALVAAAKGNVSTYCAGAATHGKSEKDTSDTNGSATPQNKPTHHPGTGDDDQGEATDAS
jgi:hypothetical protein